jgi:hypothetical protein
MSLQATHAWLQILSRPRASGDSKISSIIFYDLSGDVRVVGAEALQEQIIEQALGEGWVRLEWYAYFGD